MAEISDRPVVFVAVAVIAILVIGEVIVYTSDSSDYGAEMTMDDGIIEYDGIGEPAIVCRRRQNGLEFAPFNT